MAVRFYNELHNLSTADFYENRKASVQGKFFEIERVISKRIRTGKVGIYILFLRYIFCLTYYKVTQGSYLILKFFNTSYNRLHKIYFILFKNFFFQILDRISSKVERVSLLLQYLGARMQFEFNCFEVKILICFCFYEHLMYVYICA